LTDIFFRYLSRSIGAKIMDDPPFVARVWEFSWAVVSNYWLLLTGTVLVVEQVLEFLLPGIWRRIEARYPKGRRRRFLLWCALAAFVVASFQAYDDVNLRLRQAQKNSTAAQGRHLSSDERSRMAKYLRQNRTCGGPDCTSSFEITIDSAPNCDECEVYAQEFRDFVKSASDWSVRGGPLLTAHQGKGIQLYTAEGVDRPESAQAFSKALLEAGLAFSWETESVEAKQFFTVVINRQK
jgi:hypothetical protein